MIRRRRRSTATLYLAGDILATMLAFLAAWLLRFEFEIIELTKGVPDLRHYLGLLPLILFLWPLIFYFHGLYQSRRDRSRVDEALLILVAVAFAALLLSGLQAWFRPTIGNGSGNVFMFSRAFMGIFIALDVLAVVSSRLVLRSVLQELRLRGHNLRRILVVGAGNLGKEITHKINAHRELGFVVVGYLDDDVNKVGRIYEETPVLGTLKESGSVIAEHGIDQVYIALPPDAHRKMVRLMEQMSRECVEVKIVPDVLQYATLNASLEDLDGLPVINLAQSPLEGWNSFMKRSMDVAIASVALLAMLPFLPIVAWLIWRQDKGPIFYKQERMGLDGKPFLMYKFRSMRVNAETTTGPVWATRDDPRRTDFGSFLRRWSLDELPQVWNVLRGEMSIVGPRPERPNFVHEFKHKIPDYMLRHRVKSGITGWAQVHGWRGNTSIKKRIQYDLYYIQNWSLFLDIKIIWMTMRSGLWHNAY